MYRKKKTNRSNNNIKKSPPLGHRIVGQIVESAKVIIQMVKLSNNFGKNLWFTFIQMLNEKEYKFLIFRS